MNSDQIDLFDNMTKSFASQEAVHAVGNSLFSEAADKTGDHAILFLFSHKYIPDQWRRPHIYNFDGEFKTDLQNTISESLRKPGLALANAAMPHSVAARHAVLPAPQGQHVGLSRLSDYWTFMLVVDKGRDGGPFGTRSAIPSRMFYSGWIANEDAATKMGARWAINPQAVLSITHHSGFAEVASLGMNGGSSRVQNTADFDYAAPDVISNIETDGAKLYDMRFESVISKVAADPLGAGLQVAPAPIDHDTGAIETSAELKSPTFHLRSVVGTLTESIKHNRIDPNAADTPFGAVDVVLESAVGLARSHRNCVTRGIDPSKVYTIDELMRLYGAGFDWQVIVPEFDPRYTLADSGAVTRRNVFTSMISSSIPNLLSMFGIADVSFRYSSYAQDQQQGLFVTNEHRGMFYLLNMGMLYQTTEAEKQHAWAVFCDYLRDTVFNVIRAECGEFDLMCHSSLLGSTLIDLNLLDELPEQGLVETNNLLGGLNSPLIGTQAEFQANAEQIYGATVDLINPETSGLYDGSQMVEGTHFNSLF